MYKIITFLILLSVINVQADDKQVLLDYMKNEKMRLSVEDLQAGIQAQKYIEKKMRNKTDKIMSLLSNQEKVVSSASAPESEIHGAINPTDTKNIVVGPIKSDASGASPLSTPIYFTKDKGQTWKQSSFLTKTHQPGRIAGGGDPVFVFDKDGKVYMSWIYLYLKSSMDSLKYGVYWAYSEDGGDNWKTEDYFVVGNATGGNLMSQGIRGMHDKQWLAVDRSNSQYKNNLYTMMVDLNGKPSIVLYTKEANKKNYNFEPLKVSLSSLGLVQFSSLDVDNNGHIHMTYYAGEGDHGVIYHAVSKDGGKTIAKTTKISTLYGTCPGQTKEQGIGFNDQRLYPCPQLSIDKSTKSTAGYLYQTWTANGVTSAGATGLDIYYSVSKDGGLTWSDAKILNDNTTNTSSHQYYAATTVNNQGVFVATWYDRREDNNNRNIHYYMTTSKDGGNTFTKNVAITSKASDGSEVGASNNNFGYGEYNVTLATDTEIIPIWADGRTNNGNLNVFAAVMSLNGSGIKRINSNFNSFYASEPSPNPVGDICHFDLKLDQVSDVEIMLFDQLGNKVMDIQNASFVPGTHPIEFGVSKLQNGTYFIHCKTNNDELVTKKIIISK